ncbi:hypothetical protein C2G38_2198742 [Gigaspora rosea]|uniref:histidine kinase n=1 Tax=Gigaspora rosea TaxID=44941 RepID=A0A397UVA4_9GLOM|nr:hypothetical protein C2G38_2198742 [Gigaspora rosea]
MSLPLDYSGNNENEEQAYAKMVYNYDWSSTVLGPIDSWDPALKNALNMCLHTVFPAYLCIYPDWITIYNPVLGQPIREIWPEVFDVLNSQFESVRISGKGMFFDEFCYAVERDGYAEDAFFHHTLSPVIQSDGSVCAIFALGREITQKVLNVRRLKLVGEFGRRISEATSLESACQIITKVLSDNNADIPYALIYFVDHKSDSGSSCSIARLIATTFDYNDKTGRKFPDYLPETLEIIDLAKDANKTYDTYIELKRHDATYSFLKCDSWPISLLLKEGGHIKVLLKDGSQAVLLLTKISLGEGRVLSAILIYGINQRCALDKQYMDFLKLTLSHMNTFLLHAKTIEEEKMRSKILADLNRQKVMFFQGISHELKTPLTLMLSPLDDIITICSKEASMMSHLQLIRRNSHRLLKLINSLLQFSNIEADKLKVHYRETNIAEFTQELVSNFKNMAETLGLEYVIDIPSSDKFNQAIGDKIYLDHDMYETIVFNLCSNALKHTWKGRVTIRLYLDYKDNKKMVVLDISDTGVGIPEIALPNLFQRFYRVESQNSRSHEGTGIGLVLVKELITYHGGDITVTSVVNQGTTFKCWFPIGHEHLSTNQITNQISFENQTVSDRELYNNQQLYLEESSQWIINNTREVQNDIIDKLSTDDQDTDIDKILADDVTSHDSTVNEKKYQILLVDDNNDMRDYLADLLKEFDVLRACDGQDAIRVLKKLNKIPDLILSDVMMPNMNGYELLDLLRSNVKTRLIPVILLSAKASEDSLVEGLYRGADDYLVKPFFPQELIARIRANIELSIFRRKISFQQSKQEETKQLLFSISNKILSGLDLDETLLNIVKEIHHILPNERIFIVTNDQSGLKNNKIAVLYEDQANITSMTNQSIKFNDGIKDKSQTLTNLQKSLDNNPRIDVFLDVYCDNVCKNVSLLSAEIRLDNICWGWIKVHRSPNSGWLDSEIELLQQISNQLSLGITYSYMLEENAAKEIKIKTAEAASRAKSQILANTSHELRTPLGAIIGILSFFDSTNLTADQKEMIDILACASDIVLSIVNDILDVARLKAQKVTLMNTTFDLLELFESTIESFGKKAGTKRIELIVNCEVDMLPRYIKSDPERIKFTNKGKIVVTISMQLQDVIDEDKNKQTYGQTIKKGKLLVELYDTGIGIDPEYIKHAWQSYSQSDMSMTKMQDELRTPLGAIIGILSTFENTSLTADQREMINIMSCGSDIVLSIVNDILDVARLEAQKITLANTTFDLLELFENTIESFGKKAGTKRIELIVNCEVDKLPRYIKSDPERIKFTNEGKIIVTISMQLQDVIDEDKNKQTYGQTIKKGNFIDQKYIKQAWQSYSQSDMSMTKTQDGTGLGLSICKSLVEINGGEIDVESQLGKGSKFWFTWNIEILSIISSLSNTTQFGQISYVLPHVIKKKRILIIHPLEDTRNALLNYFKAIKKIDSFETFDEGISAAKSYKELNSQSAYDVAFIGLYKENEEEVMKATLELRGLELNDNNLIIIFIIFPNNEENELAEKLIRKVGGMATVLHTPITWKKLINQFMHMENSYSAIDIDNKKLDINENIFDTLQQVAKLGYSTISAANGLEAVKLIDSKSKLLNYTYSSSSLFSDMDQTKSYKILLIFTEYNLPLMSSFDISQTIRAMKPPISNIPIIVLTALPVEEIRNKCIELGINDCLAKPLKTEELEKVLTKWISKH